MQSDDLAGVFSGTEQLAFDLRWSDQENLSIVGAKATKVISCEYKSIVL